MNSFLRESEQAAEQGDELSTDQDNTATRHELLDALTLCAG